MVRGGKNAKKRAVVAVARKLAVLMHKLWVTGEVYDPLREVNQVKTAAYWWNPWRCHRKWPSKPGPVPRPQKSDTIEHRYLLDNLAYLAAPLFGF